jgi:hypothetical protein
MGLYIEMFLLLRKLKKNRSVEQGKLCEIRCYFNSLLIFLIIGILYSLSAIGFALV